MKLLLTLAALLAATPALAQDANAALRGVTNARLVLGLAGSEAVRQGCGATPEYADSLYDAMRDALAGAGLRVVPGRQVLGQPNPTASILGPAPNDPAVPVLLVTLTITGAQTGGEVACAFAGMGMFQARLTGARVAATGQTLPEGQSYTLWTHDTAGLISASGLPNALRGAGTRLTQTFATAWRGANPGK